ncbi:hypothetical protein UA08_07275 [Talaromyces atroroseus]|uniref:Isotrichodermin C-15 hydroxylase n=1 Tax=Talaromyces atroroseus TaxID=1441469 RepID=A0A225ARK9_TALAT|nr:hypothetical protein UA08_07275 [Talaromyces atroroseus]OKL57586.1 hypothetical protein UA08_07275 [Talaromyces atroroseus]
MHRKYGPLVRIAPDELSIMTDGEDWKLIYGTRPGHGQKQKDARFYQAAIDDYPNIILSNDVNHARMRRLLSHAFSESSLRGQGPIIGSYVNLLIQRLHDVAQNGARSVDLVPWFNYTTFDIIGDLAFGEPFNCLQGSRFIKEKIAARMKRQNDRPDFFAKILKDSSSTKDFFQRELEANAEVLIVAGSETTATLLSGAVYLLLKNPDALTKLKTEVRDAFKSEEKITLESCNRLAYPRAVLTESLRMYPPVPIGLPRIIDAQGEVVAGDWLPGGTIVSIPHFANYHSETNFRHADKFIPERHLDDPRFISDRKEVLQPFSFGPRNCIGRNLANIEMRLILCKVVFNFDMELAEPQIDWMDQNAYAFWEKQPLMVRLLPRNQTINK